MRETSQLVARAADLRKLNNGSGGALMVTTAWLREHDIIGGLLRANLHLAQYVAQVSTFPACGCQRAHSRGIGGLRALPSTCAGMYCQDMRS